MVKGMKIGFILTMLGLLTIAGFIFAISGGHGPQGNENIWIIGLMLGELAIWLGAMIWGFSWGRDEGRRAQMFVAREQSK